MSDTFRCDDKETLIGYVYGEIDIDLRRQVDGHLRNCSACAEEIEGLRDVREDLGTWLSPEPDLGFAVVSQSARVLRPARWSVAELPAWARVAAAILLMAASAAIANVQVRYDQDGFSVRTGWMPIEAAPVAPVVQPSQPDAEWRRELASLQREMQRELQAIRQTSASDTDGDRLVRTAAPRTIDGDALLRRVQTLIDQSEKRQQGEMALRFTQFTRDFNNQRRADLDTINMSFGRLQGQTQRQMMNLAQRVSTQVP